MTFILSNRGTVSTGRVWVKDDGFRWRFSLCKFERRTDRRQRVTTPTLVDSHSVLQLIASVLQESVNRTLPLPCWHPSHFLSFCLSISGTCLACTVRKGRNAFGCTAEGNHGYANQLVFILNSFAESDLWLQQGLTGTKTAWDLNIVPFGPQRDSIG